MKQEARHVLRMILWRSCRFGHAARTPRTPQANLAQLQNLLGFFEVHSVVLQSLEVCLVALESEAR